MGLRGAKGEADGWAEREVKPRFYKDEVLKKGGLRERVRGVCGVVKLMKQKKKGGELRCLLLHRKKIFFYIYDVIVKQKKRKKGVVITTPLALPPKPHLTCNPRLSASCVRLSSKSYTLHPTP
jgi:hypothetical protein